jgi:DNA repair protein RecO
MAHHVYQTEGIVLGGIRTGEANKQLALFTKELGLVSAAAQGIRLLKSKLRYSLQEYTVGSFALVRGKNVWRITSAQSSSNLHTSLQDRQNAFLAIARILSLIERLVRGEERHPELFATVLSGTEYIQNNYCLPYSGRARLQQKYACLAAISQRAALASIDRLACLCTSHKSLIIGRNQQCHP